MHFKHDLYSNTHSPGVANVHANYVCILCVCNARLYVCIHVGPVASYSVVKLSHILAVIHVHVVLCAALNFRQ